MCYSAVRSTYLQALLRQRLQPRPAPGPERGVAAAQEVRQQVLAGAVAERLVSSVIVQLECLAQYTLL